jgi:hypothetical protein
VKKAGRILRRLPPPRQNILRRNLECQTAVVRCFGNFKCLKRRLALLFRLDCLKNNELRRSDPVDARQDDLPFNSPAMKKAPKEDKKGTLRIALVTGTFTLLGTFLGAWLTSTLAHKNQEKTAITQNKLRSYSEIMGRRIIIRQLYISRFEALIFSDYHETLWHLSGDPKESLDLSEARRWMQKSEDMVSEITRAQQSLFESLAIARASFTRTQELDRLIDRIYHFKTPKISSPSGLSREELLAWREKGLKELQTLIESEFAVPLEDLLAYLQKQLDASS